MSPRPALPRAPEPAPTGALRAPSAPTAPARAPLALAAVALLGAALSGCGAAPAPAAGPVAGAPPAELVPAAEAAPPAKAKGKGKAKGGAKADGRAAGRFAPQSRAMCTPDCRLLTAYTFDEVTANYCTLCGAHDEMACELDWPTNDVPSCEIWDYYRNCIYATYGRTFEKDQWKQAFGSQPWYRPDPGYSDAKLSPVAKANIAEAQRRKADKVMCGP